MGDPFTEKVLIECCLELYAAKLVVGIQDLGGAGLSCATSELAAAGDGGMHIELDKVPLRATGMTPAEILSSESQERMCAVVTPGNVDAFLAVCRKWDVLATVIGEVTDGDRLVVTWHGETVVDVPPRTVAHEGPVYERPVQRPDEEQDALIADTPDRLARPATPEDLRATLLAMVASPALCSRRWITEQYDRYVRGNTVLAEHADAGVLRIDEETGRGIALATDASGRYTKLDPYAGAQLALAEAYRNVATTGATPIAVTNCLNFGSPEDPAVMWQFQQAVRGLADGCAELGIPVTGGNVSFYNQTGQTAILPTPVVGVLGVIDDVHRRIPTGFGREPGETLILLGDTHDEFGGSIWSQVAHDHLGGTPPRVDFDRERLLAEILVAGSRDGLISAAHDLSEGGLAQAVVESALVGETGCRILLPERASGATERHSRPVRHAVLRVRRPSAGRRAAHRGDPVHRDVQRAGDAVGAHRRRRSGLGLGRGAGPVRGDPGRAAPGLGVDSAGDLRGRRRRDMTTAPERTVTADPTLRSVDPRLAYAFDAVMARHPLLAWGWGLLKLDFTGIAFAGFFFCWSMTPSLLPRSWFFQGIVSGITSAAGYGVGVVIGWFVYRRYLSKSRRWPPPPKVLLAIKLAIPVLSVVMGSVMIVAAARWQRQLADLMGAESPSTIGYFRAGVLASLIGAVLLTIARVLRDFARLIARALRAGRVPREIANVLAVAVVAFLIVGTAQIVLVQAGMSLVNTEWSTRNNATREGAVQPTAWERSGSPGSLVPWDTLGFQGRNFVSGGLTAEELTEANGAPAKTPIRLYVGLESAPTPEDRMQLLLAELDRTGAWDRRALVVVPTTGTGWVNPTAVRAVETMFNGDTAIVATQYSYLPSWISFVTDRAKAEMAGNELIAHGPRPPADAAGEPQAQVVRLRRVAGHRGR